jgi:hypothetical protein
MHEFLPHLDVLPDWLWQRVKSTWSAFQTLSGSSDKRTWTMDHRL